MIAPMLVLELRRTLYELPTQTVTTAVFKSSLLIWKQDFNVQQLTRGTPELTPTTLQQLTTTLE